MPRTFVLHVVTEVSCGKVTGEVYARKENSRGKRIFCDNQETLCAGGIAGGSLIGIVLILLENFVLA